MANRYVYSHWEDQLDPHKSYEARVPRDTPQLGKYKKRME